MWILLLFFSASSQQCPRYNCHEGGYSIAPTCAMLSPQGNFVLQICDSQTLDYCDVSGTITNNYTCTTDPPFPSGFSYPGEPCMSNSDCITDLCTANTCVGQNPGGACVKNSDCGVGLYCSTAFFCVPQLSYGMVCTNDYQCQNNMACNRTIFEDGSCVYYYSIPNGQTVGMCQDMLTEGVSNLCQSGSCNLTNPGFDTIGVCQPPYYNLYNYPHKCSSDTDCVGYNQGSTVYGACSCGMDQDGYAYCDAFTGDPPGMTVQLLWEIHVNSSGITNCHTQRRFDMFCLRQNLGPSQVHNFLQSSVLCSDTARYQNNDYCTQAIFNHQYFDVSPANFGCQNYGCANPATFNQGTCITFTEKNNSYAINPCSSSSQPFCDITQSEANKWTNVTCQASPPKPIGYPGDYCLNLTFCISGICTNNTCQGVSQGNTCTSSSSCNVGLYCVSMNYEFTCQPLIPVYQHGCGSDYDCANGSGCRYTGITPPGPPGMCTPYFSLAINSTVPCPSNGISFLCQTGACYSSGSGMYGYCTKAPVSSGKLPVQCTLNGQCTGTNSYKQTFSGTCTCGFNNNGTSYCTPFLGDAPGVAYLKNLKTIFASSAINQCQTTRRFSQDCFGIVAKALGANANIWYASELNFTMYPYYIGNDNCVKQVYTNNFWSLLSGMHEIPELRLSGNEKIELAVE
ncbi:hypothetical protein SteCoe_6007 [Stentor coeruleus]|uniref:EGF-like domain-containing protein n=1 Tax=Stentor coeruleus TaxID=5963 RepID=A0A1R2CR05_9CILI|nr:hypothetical protein SteCoe_6007 [Stentor coeruleus]